MNQLRSVAMILACSLVNDLATAQLDNGGFESRANGKLGVTNCSTFDNPYTSSLDSVSPHSGRYSMRIKGGGGMRSFSQEIRYTATSYEQLQVKAFIRTKEIEGNAGLLAMVTGPDGKLVYANGSEGEGISKDSEHWVSYSMPVIVVPGVNKLFIGGVIHGKGFAWFDDMELLRPLQANPNGKPSNEVEKYVREYMSIIRENARASLTIDPNELESILTNLTRDAKTKPDCYGAFKFGISFLKDRHSNFFSPAGFALLHEPTIRLEDITYASGRLVEGIGYVNVPAFTGGNKTHMRLYADSLQSLIRQLDKEKPLGWIIDLRANSGGNCWPMLAGLGPFIEGDDCAYFVTKENYSEPLRYTKGASRMGEELICEVTRPYTLVTQEKKVAVLLGKRTASAGELIGICFAQRPNTLLFGSATNGLSTKNESFTLSDGAVLNLTVGVYADRNKKQYPAGIIPDRVVTADVDAIQEAVKWIKEGK